MRLARLDRDWPRLLSSSWRVVAFCRSALTRLLGPAHRVLESVRSLESHDLVAKHDALGVLRVVTGAPALVGPGEKRRCGSLHPGPAFPALLPSYIPPQTTADQRQWHSWCSLLPFQVRRSTPYSVLAAGFPPCATRTQVDEIKGARVCSLPPVLTGSKSSPIVSHADQSTLHSR